MSKLSLYTPGSTRPRSPYARSARGRPRITTPRLTTRGELTPPEAWQHRPPAPAELLRYAHKGEWTAPTGARRTAGIWWCRLIALPATVLTGYLAWMTARPSRTAVVVGLWAVLMHVPLVRTAAGWLLPFDPWPTWLP